MNHHPECTDCEHCLPDSEGPTSKGICLLDPEFGPYLDEILELNFKNCRSLIQQKNFKLSRKACSDFSPAEIIEVIDFDNFVDEIDLHKDSFNNQSSADKKHYLDIEQIDFKNLPVEPYLQNLYSASESRREKAVNTLGSLTIQGNEKAGDALINYLKELGPPKTLEQSRFKASTLRYFRGQENNNNLLEMLFSDLENTVSNNSTRQWIRAILEVMGRVPLELTEDRLQSMVNRKVFSCRLKKRVLEIIDPVTWDYY